MSTSANNTKPALCPPFKIEARISFVDREHQIQVPLGYSHAGQWCSYEFYVTEESLGLTVEQLVSWLRHADWFGVPYIHEDEEARSVVEETIQRCRALAERAQNSDAKNP